jgi:SpoVK/Ycf46/Vps4 family AAA+-type ATPase
VFRRAESKEWILVFDEADALFGMRTQVQHAHDKYANQEISYFLQRLEEYPGLVILASNFKSNIDEAFVRRFHALIHFPLPHAAERLLLWQSVMPQSLDIHNYINFWELSQKNELSGAAIFNAAQYAALQCIASQRKELIQQDLLYGIQRELLRE